LGAGQSVFAFTRQDDQYVWLVVPEHKFKDGTVAEDMSKDVLVEAYKKAPDNPYLPAIEYVGADIVFGHPELDGRYSKIYKMKYYRDLTREDDSQWMEMKRLHKVRAEGKNYVYDIYTSMGQEPSMTFLGNKAARFALIVAKKLDPKLQEAMKLLYDALILMGKDGLTFEFNLRNVALDENNHLVLRDPVYDSDITVRIKRDRASE